jgi:radical SAM protein with 4Fe4S-binding SPASM domain
MNRNQDRQIPVGEILPAEIVAQSFIAQDNFLSGISVVIATYKRKIDVTLVFRLYQNNRLQSGMTSQIFNTEPIFEKSICSDIIYDNDEYDFYFPIIKNSKGQYYCFSITSPDAVPGHAVTVWKQMTTLGEHGFLNSYCHGVSSHHDKILCQLRYSPPTTPEPTPRFILYSPVSQCNLNCIHCISRDTRKKFHRMPSHIKDKIQELCDSRTMDGIILDYSGDILFADHKHGGELDYLLGLNVDFFIDTNAHFMSKNIIVKLLSSRLQRINFSLDAGDSVTYSSIRRGGKPFSEVLANIRLFSEMRNEMGAKHVAMTLSFTLMKRNLHELPQCIDFAKEINAESVVGRHLEVYTDDVEMESLYHHQKYYNDFRKVIIDYAMQKEVVISLPRVFEERPNRTGHRYCPVPWGSVALLANGDVMACCFPTMVMGNLNEQSLEEIWNGKVYQHLRTSVNSDNPPEVCKYCPNYRLDNNRNSYLFNRVKPKLKAYRKIVND